MKSIWRIRDIIYTYFIYAIILLTFTLFVWKTLNVHHLDFCDYSDINIIFLDIISSFTMALLPLFVVIFAYESSVSEIGFVKSKINILFCILMGIILIIIVDLLYEMTTFLFGASPINNTFTCMIKNASSLKEYLIIFLNYCILAHFAEEIYFRGFVYTILRKNLNMLLSVIICSILFALSHIDPWLIVPIFIFSIVLTLLFEYSKSLVAPIIIHLMFNIVNFIYTLIVLK